MAYLRIHAQELVVLVCILTLQYALLRRAIHGKSVARSRSAIVLLLISAAWFALAFSIQAVRVSRYFSPVAFTLIRGGALIWGFFSLASVPFLAFLRRIEVRPEHSPQRRVFLRTAQAGLIAAPLAACGYAVFVQRHNISLTEADIPIPGLPKELHGLKIVQLSDIHLSAFLSERELAYAVDLANETRANLALVTGDLITSRGDPLDVCIKQLARLRSDAGTLGCLGNHEVYTRTEERAASEGARVGIDFLRGRSRQLRFNGKSVNFAGVDYQPINQPYLVGTEKLIESGVTNILLSHNPDVFPVAARQGYHLTIAGHTHGGQVGFEILHHNVSLARFYTPYVQGTYKIGNSSIYVTRGIGTVGLPARLGVPPEVSLLRLCAT